MRNEDKLEEKRECQKIRENVRGGWSHVRPKYARVGESRVKVEAAQIIRLIDVPPSTHPESRMTRVFVRRHYTDSD